MRPLHPHSCSMQALTLLIALPLLLSTSLYVTARLEVKGTRDYQSVKEDFLCRACVHLGEVFYDEVLPPISSRYRTANRASASPASPSASPTANTAENEASQPQRHTPQVSHRQREQMIVEVHEAIDELCTTLDTSIQRQVVEASSITAAADADAVALQLLSPLVTSLDLREGVLTACPMALEEINEALADTAFQHLLPSEKSSASSSKATHTDDRDTAPSAAQSDDANASVPYELPAAGAFCERVGLCSSFVHYHITSETAVRRRAQEGHEAAKKAADATTTSSTGSASSSAKTKKSAKASPSKTAKRAGGSTTTAGPYAVDGKAEDETFLQTLQRVFELRTWYALKDVLNATEVASLGFWVDGLRLVVDPSVLFHLQAYVPVMGVYALSLAFLLAVVVQIVVFGCPCLPRRAERGAAGAEGKQNQAEKKVQ